MQSVETVQAFDRFRAASVATDTAPAIDAVVNLDEGSTDPYTVRRSRAEAAEALLNRSWGRFGEAIAPFLSTVANEFSGGWHTGSSDIQIPELASDEAPISDFDVLDDLRTPRGQIQRQIGALRAGGGLPYSQRLAHRLDFLLGAREEEGESWEEGSPDSLRQMLLFLRSVPDLPCPTVTVTPSATFRAQWQAGWNSHLAIDFLPDGQVRFVVFSPDARRPDRVQRVSGIVGRIDVMRVVEPYKVHRWAVDARG